MRAKLQSVSDSLEKKRHDGIECALFFLSASSGHAKP